MTTFFRRMELVIHRRADCCLLLLLTMQTGLLVWTAARNSPVADEIAHLPAGLSQWRFGRFDLYRVNPPLVRSVAAFPLLFVDHAEDWRHYQSTPMVREEFDVGRAFVQVNGRRIFDLVFVARLACLPFSLLGTVVCYRWSRQLWGRRGGVFAAGCWVFSPNLLAHGALITPDAAAASTGLLAAWLFWRWLNRPTHAAALVCGLSLGLAVLTKSTWIILFGVWPVLFITDLWFHGKPNIRQRSLQLFGILTAGLYTINAGYLFEGSMTEVRDYRFQSQTLKSCAEQTRQPSTATGRMLQQTIRRLPVPLPRSFVEGIDLQKLDFEQGQPSYIAGSWHHRGRWYYYLYAFLMKLPPGTLLIVFLCILFTAARSLRQPAFETRTLVLLIPPLVVLLLVSSQTGIQKHLRYALPVIPFTFVAAAASLKHLRSKSRRTMRMVLCIALLWTATSCVLICPHSLSYFNGLAGGPGHGSRHLLGTNLDWGQSLIALIRWNDSRLDSKPLFVSYSGLFDPADVGIPCHAVSHSEPLPPGWYAISLNHLHGFEPLPKKLRQLKPQAVLDYSMALFLIE